jgi:hypothetical protein
VAAAGQVTGAPAAAGAAGSSSNSSLVLTAAMLPVVESTAAPTDLLNWAMWAPTPELAAKLAGDAGAGGLAGAGLGVPAEVAMSCCKLLLEGLADAGMVLHCLPVAQLMRLLGSVSLRNEVGAIFVACISVCATEAHPNSITISVTGCRALFKLMCHLSFLSCVPKVHFLCAYSI